MIHRPDRRILPAHRHSEIGHELLDDLNLCDRQCREHRLKLSLIATRHGLVTFPPPRDSPGWVQRSSSTPDEILIARDRIWGIK
jgi:hypothetical protein